MHKKNIWKKEGSSIVSRVGSFNLNSNNFNFGLFLKLTFNKYQVCFNLSSVYTPYIEFSFKALTIHIIQP